MLQDLLIQTQRYWGIIKINYMEISKFQYITNYTSATSHLDQVKAAIKGGVKWIQYRPKNISKVDMIKEGQEIASYCKEHSVTFIMNDSVDIAMELHADGVHLGKEDMSPAEARKILGNNKIIGGTANTVNDIVNLTNMGVNYVGLGPYRFTNTKKNLSPILGLDGYKTILADLHRSKNDIPIIAIGGITELDIPLLLNTGVYGIALSSLISESSDISQKTESILNLF